MSAVGFSLAVKEFQCAGITVLITNYLFKYIKNQKKKSLKKRYYPPREDCPGRCTGRNQRSRDPPAAAAPSPTPQETTSPPVTEPPNSRTTCRTEKRTMRSDLCHFACDAGFTIQTQKDINTSQQNDNYHAQSQNHYHRRESP